MGRSDVGGKRVCPISALRIGRMRLEVRGGIRACIAIAKRIWNFSNVAMRTEDCSRACWVGEDNNLDRMVRRISSVGWNSILAISDPGLSPFHGGEYHNSTRPRISPGYRASSTL